MVPVYFSSYRTVADICIPEVNFIIADFILCIFNKTNFILNEVGYPAALVPFPDKAGIIMQAFYCFLNYLVIYFHLQHFRFAIKSLKLCSVNYSKKFELLGPKRCKQDEYYATMF